MLFDDMTPSLDQGTKEPKYNQLARQIETYLTNRAVPTGTRLPSVSVAHASAKAWKLGFNLRAKSSGLAKVEFSAILQQEDPRNINQHPRC